MTATASTTPITLTLNSVMDVDTSSLEDSISAIKAEDFSPEALAEVQECANQLDLNQIDQVLSYGNAAQQKIVNFSDEALSQAKTKDMGEVGETLSGLVAQLQTFGMEKPKGLKGLFAKPSLQVATMKAQYETVASNLQRMTGQLQQHQRVLLQDIQMLNGMYDTNVAYFKELSMYIFAGRQKLQEIENTVLVKLKDKAAAKDGTQVDAMNYNDMVKLCDRFRQKLYDLELTRIISLQMGPQIRLLQENDTQMIEKIQSSLAHVVPLWKSQMVLTLGLEHSRQAIAAQQAISNMTNSLLKKNAELLHQGAVATAKEAARSVVDIETLKETNQKLIDTLDEVMAINQTTQATRKNAESELKALERELQQKLAKLN